MTAKDIRKKTNLSQSQFAEKLGIPVRTIQQWEQAKSSPPDYVLNLINSAVACDFEVINNDYISKYRLNNRIDWKENIVNPFANYENIHPLQQSHGNSWYKVGLSHYNSARILRNNLSGDENQLNIIAYLLQQAVELVIKYLLEQNAVEYPKTHDIDQLIRLAKEKSVDLFLTDYIDDHAEMFSQWESKSRYVLGYLVEIDKIDKAIDGIDGYLKNVSTILNGQ